MKTYTSKSGKVLREFLERVDPFTERVAFYPETGLDSEEQAYWIKENIDKFDVVYTLSPFIISDSKELFLIHDLTSEPEKMTGLFGASVNKVTMNLWRGCMVGEITRTIIDETKEIPNTEKALKKLDELGDSIEKLLCVNALLNRVNKPKIKI